MSASNLAAAAEEAGLAALLDLAMAEKNRSVEFATISLGPFSAFSLVGCLQLAWRHPALSRAQKKIIEDFAQQISSFFGSPISELIELGWDVGRDV